MKFALISFLLLGFIVKINLINSLPTLGEINTEKKIASNYLAKKYCDSLEKNLFKGLDKESILKYEYFFSAIPNNSIQDKDKFLKKFKSDVKSICSYEISKSNEQEFNSFLIDYFKTRSNTPKTKVEEIKKEDKVAEEENMEPQKKLEKES